MIALDILPKRVTSNTIDLLQRKQFAEFFAGIGLVRMGLEQAGWSLAFANDFDPLKEKMYKANVPDAFDHFVLEDIFALEATHIPHVALATASFPCKNLSLAGNLDGFEGNHSSAIWGFTRLLEKMQDKKPPILMLENVTGFLKANKGENLKLVLQDLNDLGYSTDIFVLDAANFVPQSRQRMFIVSLLEDVFPIYNNGKSLFGIESDVRTKEVATFIVNHPEIKWNIRQLPSLPKNISSLESIVEDLPDDSHLWWSSERATYLLNQMSPRHSKVARQMIAAHRWSYGTVFRRMRNGSSTAELRTDGLAGCLRTPAGGSAKQILFKAGYEKYYVQLITPREAARLMGADDFNITVSSDQALFGFGDAVCVPAIEWIARNYLNPIINELVQGSNAHQDDSRGREFMDLKQPIQAQLDAVFEEWYSGIDKDDGKSGWESICGGITLIENLLENYSLDIAQHRTKSGTQLRNQGLALGNRVLKKFNTGQRLTTGEFGRTSRGAPRAAERLLTQLEALHLEDISPEERSSHLNYLEELMVRALLLLMGRGVKEVKFDSSYTTERAIEILLENASGASSGAIAQHLVGAKLEMRFPDLLIKNEPASAADEPTNRSGDFHVGDAVLHITITPQDAVFEKCKLNLAEGKNVYLLVSAKRVPLASSKAHKHNIANNIVVNSIESFVAQNIDEIALFSKEKLHKERERLLSIYNRRIKEVNERHAPFLIFENGELLSIADEAHQEQKINDSTLKKAHYTYEASLFDLQQHPDDDKSSPTSLKEEDTPPKQ